MLSCCSSCYSSSLTALGQCTRVQQPTVRGALPAGLPTEDGLFGFVPFSEVWVGRLAMMVCPLPPTSKRHSEGTSGRNITHKKREHPEGTSHTKRQTSAPLLFLASSLSASPKPSGISFCLQRRPSPAAASQAVIRPAWIPHSLLDARTRRSAPS